MVPGSLAGDAKAVGSVGIDALPEAASNIWNDRPVTSGRAGTVMVCVTCIRVVRGPPAVDAIDDGDGVVCGTLGPTEPRLEVDEETAADCEGETIVSETESVGLGAPGAPIGQLKPERPD